MSNYEQANIITGHLNSIDEAKITVLAAFFNTSDCYHGALGKRHKTSDNAIE